MKQKWISLNKWNKIGIILLFTAFLVMILGLILIGAANMPARTVNMAGTIVPIPSQNGFDVLKSTSIGQVLTHSAQDASWNNGPWLQLQLGAIFAAIVTPILAISSITVFGYSFSLNNKK